MNIEELESLYESKKGIIKERLDEFKKTGKSSDDRILAELCFCICTPQSKATTAWFNAVHPLMRSGKLYSCCERELADYLRKTGVRFHRTKARNIVLARKFFEREGIGKVIGRYKNALVLRDFLVENVRGLGLKEASHFLRNIGLGEDVAILDRHVLKSLAELGVIDDVPESMTRKRYLEIEEGMRKFSKKVKIPMDELDLLLWFGGTGEVFK